MTRNGSSPPGVPHGRRRGASAADAGRRDLYPAFTAQRTDARGWPTSYTLDALGRTTGQVYLDGGRVTYLFDASGRLAAMGDGTGTTSHTYDAAGRQTKVVYPIGKHLSYSYDGLGNRATLIDQDGGTTTYTYDARNQLAAVVNPFAERTTWIWDALVI